MGAAIGEGHVADGDSTEGFQVRDVDETAFVLTVAAGITGVALIIQGVMTPQYPFSVVPPTHSVAPARISSTPESVVPFVTILGTPTTQERIALELWEYKNPCAHPLGTDWRCATEHAATCGDVNHCR